MNRNDEPVPLWRQLNATAQVILAVRGGASGTAAIERVSADLRPGVQALAFHVWRNLGRAQALAKKLASRPPPPDADALLCVALALAWQGDGLTYDMFTLVNQAVEAAKHNVATRPQANFLNACLRRFLREKDALVASTESDLVAVWNHPTWWIKRLRHEYPQRWQQILQAANRHAPMSLRVNIRHHSVAQYLDLLAQAGTPGQTGGGASIVLERPVAVHLLPGFAQGWVSVQDTAAQLAAPLLLDGLQPQPNGLRVLDACAAPGGKTGHLLEIGDAQVTALDIDADRTLRIGQNLTRLGLQAQVLTADAAHPEGWWDGQAFDAILLDAPCTASGIVRRHPDVRWLRRETDIAQLAAIQKRMLQTLWGLLRPGGRLLYCTCSLFQAEGSGQVQTFLVHNTDAHLLPSPGHLTPGSIAKAEAVPDNARSDHDGFYYALLEKRVA